MRIAGIARDRYVSSGKIIRNDKSAEPQQSGCKHMRKDLLPHDPGIAVPQLDGGGSEAKMV